MTTPNAAALRLAPINGVDKSSTIQNPNRIPSTTQYTAILGSLRNVLNDIALEKMSSRAFLAATRTETSIFHENEGDRPDFAISGRRLAESANVDRSTVTRDLAAITALADYTGLWLQSWESGGKDFEADETSPNVFEWPSPLGRLLEATHRQLKEILIAKGKLTKRQRKYHVEIILHEEITKIIGSEKMQQLHQAKQKEREDRKAQQKSETRIEREERITHRKAQAISEEVDKKAYEREVFKSILGKLKGLQLDGLEVPKDIFAWFVERAGGDC